MPRWLFSKAWRHTIEVDNAAMMASGTGCRNDTGMSGDVLGSVFTPISMGTFSIMIELTICRETPPMSEDKVAIALWTTHFTSAFWLQSPHLFDNIELTNFPQHDILSSAFAKCSSCPLYWLNQSCPKSSSMLCYISTHRCPFIPTVAHSNPSLHLFDN